jgi:hypothetical protein
MCPHTIILLYMCPRTAVYVSSYYYTAVYVSSYGCICVLIHYWATLLNAYANSIFAYTTVCMCPRTAVYVRSYTTGRRNACTLVVCIYSRGSTTFVSSYYYIRVLIQLHMCHHSFFLFRCLFRLPPVLVLHLKRFSKSAFSRGKLNTGPFVRLCMCPHTAMYVSSYHFVSSFYYICVHILLYMCPLICVLILCVLVLLCVLILLYVSSYCYIYVLILLYVSSYCYICVLLLLYVSSYFYICVLILLYVSSHNYRYVLICCIWKGSALVVTRSSKTLAVKRPFARQAEYKSSY